MQEKYEYSTDNIKIKLLDKNAIVPKISDIDRVISFYANEDLIFLPNKRIIIKLNLIMSFNKEHVLFISNVPQISMLNGLYTIPKFIRSSITENLLITMENTTSQRANIKKGQKIAEGILIPIPFTQIEVVKELA